MSILAAAALASSLMTPAVVVDAPAQQQVAPTMSTMAFAPEGTYQVWAQSYGANQITHLLQIQSERVDISGTTATWVIKNIATGAQPLSGSAKIYSQGGGTQTTNEITTSLSSIPAGDYNIIYKYGSNGGSVLKQFTKTSSGSIINIVGH